MFGYIVLSTNANKEDRELYKKFYCGLCNSLKNKYGKEGTMCLSYDMTFLTLLLSDIEDSPKSEGKEKCSIHPVSGREYILTPVTDYTSDMQILLSYYDLLDDKKDDGKESKLLKSLSSFIPSLEEKYPRQSGKIKEVLSALDKEEKNNSKDYVALSYLCGEMLGEVFVRDEKNFFSPGLRSIGVSLGRFVYLIDAWEDRKRDERKNVFNPLPEDITKEKIKEVLLDAASTAAAEFEKLPLDDYVSIMRNILYKGIWTRVNIGEIS